PRGDLPHAFLLAHLEDSLEKPGRGGTADSVTRPQSAVPGLDDRDVGGRRAAVSFGVGPLQKLLQALELARDVRGLRRGSDESTDRQNDEDTRAQKAHGVSDWTGFKVAWELYSRPVCTSWRPLASSSSPPPQSQPSR